MEGVSFLDHPARKAIRALWKEMEGLRNQEKELHLKIRELEKELRENPDHEHDWIRDNHLYSDLYCKHCGVHKR